MDVDDNLKNFLTFQNGISKGPKRIIGSIKRVLDFKHALASASLLMLLTSGCAAGVTAAGYTTFPAPAEKPAAVSTSTQDKTNKESAPPSVASTPPAAEPVEHEKELQRDEVKFVREHPYNVKDIKVPVIMYHKFLERTSDINVKNFDLEVTVDEFKQGLINLKNEGYSVISLETLYKFIKYGNPIPKDSVVLTFDDGWKFRKDIADLLKSLGFTVNDAIISNYPGFSVESSNYDPKSYFSWDEIIKLIKEGVIIPENHTMDHPFLSRISAHESMDEIDGAEKSILEHTGTKPEALVLPYGDGEGNKRIIEQAKKAGIKMIVTTSNRLNVYKGETSGDYPIMIYRYSAVHGLDLAKQVDSLLGKNR